MIIMSIVVYMSIIVIKILMTHVQETVCHRFLWKFRIEIIQFILLVKQLPINVSKYPSSSTAADNDLQTSNEARIISVEETNMSLIIKLGGDRGFESWTECGKFLARIVIVN